MMKGVDKMALLALRARIPVGMADAMTLLLKCSNNLEYAENLWKQQVLDHLLKKAGTDQQKALDVLTANNWDLAKSVIALESSKLSLTERVLHSSSDPETVLFRIARLITEENDWLATPEPFISIKNHDRPNPFQYRFYTLNEWLAYLDYEGFVYAIGVKHIQEIITILEEMGISPFADAIRQVINRKQADGEEYAESIDTEDYVAGMNRFRDDSIFRQAEEYFHHNRTELYRNIITYIEVNEIHFPQ